MTETYEWLYDNYAKDLLAQIAAEEQTLVEATLDPMDLPGSQRLAIYDLLTDLRVHSGLEIFTLGLQLGIRLTAPCMGFKPNIVQ